MRKTVIVITAFLLWAECLFFLVYTFITPEANPTSLALLRLVASAGFLALVTGSVAHWFDAREAKAVRSELEATKLLISRQLSNTGKHRLKKVFSDCGGTQFIVRVDEDDDEACPLAWQIGSTCPRRGGPKVVWPLPRVPGLAPLPSGVGIVAGPKQDDPEWAAKTIRDLSAAFKACGIGLSNSSARFNPSDPLGEGVIEINVGPRPPA